MFVVFQRLSLEPSFFTSVALQESTFGLEARPVSPASLDHSFVEQLASCTQLICNLSGEISTRIFPVRAARRLSQNYSASLSLTAPPSKYNHSYTIKPCLYLIQCMPVYVQILKVSSMLHHASQLTWPDTCLTGAIPTTRSWQATDSTVPSRHLGARAWKEGWP